MSSAAGAATLSFSPGTYYVVVDSVGAVPVDILGAPLFVSLDQPVLGNTFIAIDSSVPGSLQVDGGGSTIPTGQSSGVVQTTALQLGQSTLTASFEDVQAMTLVNVVTALPAPPAAAVPVMTAPWLLVSALGVLGWIRTRQRSSP
jgi:hypothetical protein